MARTFKDIEEQMASVGIYIPPGFELYANRDNWKRFKPRDSRFKRGKEAWFANLGAQPFVRKKISFWCIRHWL